ncbi:large conductance mechanosensitive channel protein MscL [Corynebacteriaceae bacterium 7-707]
MFKGFKDFITRGNVMELAIAVIIGSAFTAIVTAISDSLIQPLINSFGGAEVDGLKFQLRDGMESTQIDLGAIITAVINFLIIAGVVYFLLVAPMNKLNELNARRKGIDPEETIASEVDLLVEIRDLIATQSGVSSATNGLAGEIDDSTDTGGRHSAR